MAVWDKRVISHSASFCCRGYRYQPVTLRFFMPLSPERNTQASNNPWSMLVTGQV